MWLDNRLLYGMHEKRDEVTEFGRWCTVIYMPWNGCGRCGIVWRLTVYLLNWQLIIVHPTHNHLALTCMGLWCMKVACQSCISDTLIYVYMGPRVGCWAAHLRRNESTITYHAERTLTKGSIQAGDPFPRQPTSPWPMAGDLGSGNENWNFK